MSGAAYEDLMRILTREDAELMAAYKRENFREAATVVKAMWADMLADDGTHPTEFSTDDVLNAVHRVADELSRRGRKEESE